MKIITATVTGADDRTDPSDLIRLSEKYPFVEWGILVSEKQEGGSRFPSREWIGKLLEAASINKEMMFAVHLCGRMVRQMVESPTPDDPFSPCGYARKLIERADRIQLNFHGDKHRPLDDRFPQTIAAILNTTKDVIFQHDGVNESLWTVCSGMTGPLGNSALPLFDLSGGAGVEYPWKKIETSFAGYAGGLDPHRLGQQIEDIERAVGGQTVWLDIETRVRNPEPVMRMDLVEKYLETIASSGKMGAHFLAKKS